MQVLAKLPVIQHFRFGTLLRATWEPSRKDKGEYGSVAAPGEAVPASDGAPSGAGGGAVPGDAMCVAPWAAGARGAPGGAMGMAPWAAGGRAVRGGAAGVAPWSAQADGREEPRKE